MRRNYKYRGKKKVYILEIIDSYTYQFKVDRVFSSKKKAEDAYAALPGSKHMLYSIREYILF